MDREKAKQILESWLLRSKGTEERIGYIEGWFFKGDEEAFDMAIEALQEPKVTPTERTGEWEYIINPIGEADRYVCVCSKCKMPKQQGYSSFCGNCGVKMKG